MTAIRSSVRPELRRWVAGCTVAEAIGMTAAAGAARAAQHVGAGVSALAIVVVGGLVESTALGVLQGRCFPAAVGRRWAIVTAVVGGIGWAAAGAPSALMSDDGARGQPPWVVVVGGALALGAVMGAVLGAAQSTALRGAVRHPRQWVAISTLAWTPTMAIMFLAATLPDDGWATSSVVALGTVTGVVAGALLGGVSGWLMPALEGGSTSGRLVIAMAPLLPHQLLVLTVRGKLTARAYEFPVQYAEDDQGYVVVPGHADRKIWWRNLHPAATVLIRRGRHESTALGMVLHSDEPGYVDALRTYRARWKAKIPADQPIVRLIPR